jgi:hypothetical protein
MNASENKGRVFARQGEAATRWCPVIVGMMREDWLVSTVTQI